MEVSLEKLLKGKSTNIKGVDFLSTKDYVQPFVDAVHPFTSEFVIKVQAPDQITYTDKEEDLTYNRVWVQAIMPSDRKVGQCVETLNLVYALDVRKPFYKVFRSYINAEGNMVVFNSNWMDVQKLDQQSAPVYNVKSLLESTNDIPIKLENMNKTFIDDEDKQQFLGKLVERTLLFDYTTVAGKVKLSSDFPIKAYTATFFDSTSKYYTKDTEESTLYNFYNAMVQLITDDSKDILTKFEKTILVGSLMNLTNDYSN